MGGADLPFTLDFYTEVQDLHQLLPALNAELGSSSSESKWEKLNDALIDLITDYGLVGFETLAVEDRASMASLLRAIDRASGYALAGSRGTDEQGRTLNDEASIWAQAMSDHWAGKLDVRDIQERWIDRKEEFDEMERKEWEEEARIATATARKDGSGAAAQESATDPTADAAMNEEDEMLDEQRKWQEEQRRKGQAPSANVVRKSS